LEEKVALLPGVAIGFSVGEERDELLLAKEAREEDWDPLIFLEEEAMDLMEEDSSETFVGEGGWFVLFACPVASVEGSKLVCIERRSPCCCCELSQF
jgi:hypothetical protein